LIRYHVTHQTVYRYAAPVLLSHQLLHLTPRVLPWQALHSHAITVSPEPVEKSERDDDFGNPVRQLLLAAPHQTLDIVAESDLTVASRAARARATPTGPWEPLRERLRSISYSPPLEPAQFLYESPHIECLPELGAYAARSFTPRRPVLEGALDLARRIHEEFEFSPEATSVSTPLREVLKLRRGVCQDFAHLMIACLRVTGLSARYVSGYLLTQPPPGRPRMVGADASHAWVSVWCPPAGWVDVDPTNDCLVDDEHITLGWGRDFSDVTPTRGVILGGGEQELEVRVTVSPLAGAPIKSKAHG
jgi:transglutaminase-like putative cysteine protease